MSNLNDQATSSAPFSIDIEQLLASGTTIKIKPQGYSMYPLFVPGRDEACIERTDFSSLKRGDVILYRRDKSILVLHRIWKITGNSFYIVGDNQTEIEGPLRADQLHGKLTGGVRNGKCPLSNRFCGLKRRPSPIGEERQEKGISQDKPAAILKTQGQPIAKQPFQAKHHANETGIP